MRVIQVTDRLVNFKNDKNIQQCMPDLVSKMVSEENQLPPIEILKVRSNSVENKYKLPIGGDKKSGNETFCNIL